MPAATRAAALALVAGLTWIALGAGSSPASPPPAATPLVTVVQHGGLCRTPAGGGAECRSTFRITDTTISGTGYVRRRLAAGERRALLTAMRGLDRAYLRAHPFRGMCPTATDSIESIYRFRGFDLPLESCTYDLRGVRAVRLVERLLGTLKTN